MNARNLPRIEVLPEEELLVDTAEAEDEFKTWQDYRHEGHERLGNGAWRVNYKPCE